MSLFQPNVKRLAERRDVLGLLRALQYPKAGEKAAAIRKDAADELSSHRHWRVLEALMEVATSSARGDSFDDEYLPGTALRSAQNMLYELYDVHRQEPGRFLAWWRSGGDKADEARKMMQTLLESSRAEQLQYAKREIDDRLGTPMAIKATAHSLCYDIDSVSDEERQAYRRWQEQADKDRAPLYAKARADLDARWASEDAQWAREEAALEKWVRH